MFKLASITTDRDEIVKLYLDGIAGLKRIELHEKLKDSSKRFLIDIYYKEKAMNNFKDSCVTQLAKLNTDAQKIEKDFTTVYPRL
jgi:hypothetical protein